MATYLCRAEITSPLKERGVDLAQGKERKKNDTMLFYRALNDAISRKNQDAR